LYQGTTSVVPKPFKINRALPLQVLGAYEKDFFRSLFSPGSMNTGKLHKFWTALGK